MQQSNLIRFTFYSYVIAYEYVCRKMTITGCLCDAIFGVAD